MGCGQTVGGYGRLSAPDLSRDLQEKGFLQMQKRKESALLPVEAGLERGPPHPRVNNLVRTTRCLELWNLFPGGSCSWLSMKSRFGCDLGLGLCTACGPPSGGPLGVHPQLYRSDRRGREEGPRARR